MEQLNFEQISFEIIAYSGSAKTFAMNAIQAAKKNDFKEALNLLNQADDAIISAEKAHMDVIALEANGIKVDFPVLFIHAEDQLLTTQSLVIIAQEFVDLYKNFIKK